MSILASKFNERCFVQITPKWRIARKGIEKVTGCLKWRSPLLNTKNK